MAEPISIQQLKDASEDVKSLEEVVNGDENVVVTTRLGETYPSVKGSIKKVFENGGLPATPFDNKAAMEGSDLVDGDYAYVTDDTTNSGLYVKTAGAWVKSAYDPLSSAKDFTTQSIIDLKGSDELEIEFIEGYAILTAPNASTITSAFYPDRGYAKVDVDGYGYVSATVGSEHEGWNWVFTDSELTQRILQTETVGNISMPVPDGAKYLLRTTRIGSTVDRDITVKGYRLDKTLSDAFNAVSNLDDSTVKKGSFSEVVKPVPINGAAVNTSPSVDTLLASGSGREYIKIDVANASYIDISNSNGVDAGFKLAYSKDGVTKFAMSDEYGNTRHKVPDGAVYAYRSYRTSSFAESDDLKIEVVKEYPNSGGIYDDIKQLKEQSNKESAQYLIENSNMPLYKLSEFVGADSDAKIRKGLAFIKTSGQGILDLESGTHVINSALLLPSNCWLYLNDATLKLANGVFDNIIRNDGIVLGSDPNGYAAELNENHNIRIFGNGKGASGVHGSDIPYTAPHPINGGDPVPWVGDFYGWRTLPINLVNVKNYAIHDFNMRQTTCWAITQQHGCEDFEIYNIDIVSTVKNGDGIDVLMGCKNGVVKNITGYTYDDMVALSGVQGFHDEFPSGNYIYPMMIGGYFGREWGSDIENITIQNIKGGGKHNAVRLLAQGGSKLKNISINNVSDATGQAFAYSLVLIGGTGYGADAGAGDMSNITVNNVTTNISPRAIRFNGLVSDSMLNNITQNNLSGMAIDYGDAELTNVVIENVMDT